jgi:2-C-methyl-D-erythritol 2,4-cyclodiphosphate synthase
VTGIRTGIGWDNHRLAHGRPLILGGIRIESDVGLEGHSDADVLSHAITDAMLGAAALGDIGLHFPDSDPQWKGAESSKFLNHVCDLVRRHGWQIANIDSTIILESPKLKDYRMSIRECLAKTIGIETERISVKFKTSEKMGPVGEGRAAEAQAIVTLTK